MKTLTTYLITIVVFFATGCSISPGITAPPKEEINWDEIYVIAEKDDGVVEANQETNNQLMESVYGLEGQISRDVFRTKEVNEAVIKEKYTGQFDNTLAKVLINEKVPVEVWDSIMRMAIIIEHESVETILSNMELSFEDRIHTRTMKNYPVIRGYLGKLYPGWPSLGDAQRVKRGFKIHSESPDNLSLYMFHMIKQVRKEHPEFVFQFFGLENMEALLYAAEVTIEAVNTGKSYYPDPIDMTNKKQEKRKKILQHLEKYRQLIRRK